MNAYIQFGKPPGPFQTVQTEVRVNSRSLSVFWAGRWYRIRGSGADTYININRECVGVTFQ